MQLPEPPPIRRLEEAVVNRIAAGEIIQRPASALKELVENSLDAGSSAISIVIKDGGLKLIQITDNGHGIRGDDLPILCERHTTSKLKEFEDLETIETLGFRGEALASISFVAHLTVTTMTGSQAHGLRATYKDGALEGEAKPCAAVRGTQIVVENLFYNVPTRRKAFRSPSEEYARILDVVSRFAVHKTGVSFSCKKHGESRADIYTTATANRVDAVRAVYGPSVAREVIPLEVAEGEAGEPGSFRLEGFISSANYSAKKTTHVLFINDRMVECGALKRACEAVYGAILPKASKPFLYMSIHLPSRDVDVNVHPTKREVSFLNQEALVEAVQKAVEGRLLASNTSRTFYTQTVLPGAPPAAENDGGGSPPMQGGGRPSGAGQSQKAPENKLVRTDERAQAGAMRAFTTSAGSQGKKRGAEAAEEAAAAATAPDFAATRRAVRQRRNPAGSPQLTSMHELLTAVERQNHAGLEEILKHLTFVGMADDSLALVQHKTRLYLVNIVSLSKELVYQQILRRFSHFNYLRLSSPAPIHDLLMAALDDEEAAGRWHESEGDKEEIAKLNMELLVCKAEMVREYFGVDIDPGGNLRAIPMVLDHYTPDLERLPQLVLALGNDVDWEMEKECFETLAAALADFYALHPPSVPQRRPPRDPLGQATAEGDAGGEEGEEEEEDERATEAVWAQREWTIQHLFLPAVKLFLKPPNHMANDGTIVQVACLENLYKIFERC